jgi:8-amino-7-oxononanoate synthase
MLRRDHDATLVVDESHAVGVFGPRGAGIAAERDILDDVDVLVGTFGKALGSYGAFVVCDGALREFLINKARSFIFTTALTPAVVNWTSATLIKALDMDRERGHLLQLADQLRAALTAAGVQTGGNTQIVPVHIGETQRAVDIAVRLRDAGYLALPIRPPTVPPGTARLRLSLTANMTWDQIAGLPGKLAGMDLCSHNG